MGMHGGRTRRGFSVLGKEDAAAVEALRRKTSELDAEGLVDRYLFGMCGPMALAIHEMTGWPTVGVFDVEGGWWTDKPLHVACLGPDGYADARGTGMDEETLTERYRRAPDAPAKVVRPFPPDAIREMYVMRTVADHALAAEHAERLLPGLVADAGPAPGP